jgi:hypothetical protein
LLSSFIHADWHFFFLEGIIAPSPLVIGLILESISLWEAQVLLPIFLPFSFELVIFRHSINAGDWRM